MVKNTQLETFINKVVGKELSKYMSPKDVHITCHNLSLGAEELDKLLEERDKLVFFINGFIYELLFELDLHSMFTEAMKIELKKRICTK